MLVFVIPLMSAQTAKSWTFVTELATRTIRSACAQTCPDFRVIVVCNEVPEIGFKHASLEFLSIDSPPPGPERHERSRDQGRKVYEGLRRALCYRPSHVMVLDADDCVSKRLASYVACNLSANGWYIKKGYFHKEDMPTVHCERRRFHMWCGSSHVLRPENLDLPNVYIDGWRLYHTRTVPLMRTRGTPIQALPFPGAVYNVSHGENMNDYASILWPRNPLLRLARRALFLRPITTEIREEFGLYPLGGAL